MLYNLSLTMRMGGLLLTGGGGAGGKQISSIVHTRSFKGNLKLISLSLIAVVSRVFSFALSIRERKIHMQVI